MIKMNLFDYAGVEYWIEVPVDLEDVALMWIDVVTGDEHLKVVTKCGDMYEYYSNYATALFWDGYVELIKNGNWIIGKEEFMHRKGAYDYWSLQE